MIFSHKDDIKMEDIMEEFYYSARLNSFATKPELYWQEGKQIETIDLIDRLSKVKGLTHVELNYPQHIENTNMQVIKDCLEKNDLKLSGIALRYGDYFNNGTFSNLDTKIRKTAIEVTKQAVEATLELGGSTTTLWFAHDGFDYSFQSDYEKAWNLMIEGIREVAVTYPDSQISIEYKPYQPRAFSLISDIGTTLLAIEDTGCENIGVTLDFCHMIMKKENPAFSLALAAFRKKLVGIHVNDGYKDNDDGLMIGSVHFMQTLEFIYYLKKYRYQGLVYFDTFPVREDPIKECELNISMFKRMSAFIDNIGMDKIEEMIQGENALESQKLLACMFG